MKQNRVFPWGIAVFCLMFIIGVWIGFSSSQHEAEPVPSEPPPQEIKILFIGNSYTFTNDFPGIFARLAQEDGRNLNIATRAAGGWTLRRHAESNETIETIQETAWDHVVLQEQSVIPSDPEERVESMYPAVRSLHHEIDQIDADVLLFMTWGRRDGLPEKGYRGFEEMQTEITRGYLEIANELDLAVAPVGTAWQRVIAEEVGLDLWQSDGSHPNMAGSYLAACVFYATVFRESPEGLNYAAGLDEDVRNNLQSIAAETVLEDSAQWNIK